MSFTKGQEAYLFELLSHEYVLTEKQRPVIQQAICQYATTAYTQTELDYLLAMPQSLAACFYYPCSKQGFAQQYGLWLNCLEYCIFYQQEGLEAILLNPDPTSQEKLFALIRQDENLQVMVLPPLSFYSTQQNASCSCWTLQEVHQSMQHFLQYARQPVAATQSIEALTWPTLLQQARLFSMVKETYQFDAYKNGLPKPSNYPQFPTKAAVASQPVNPHKQGWLYQPPRNPFAGPSHFMKQLKQSLAYSAKRPAGFPFVPAHVKPLFAPLPFFQNRKKH